MSDIDYQQGPRGDGYPTAGASSSGSACAIAACHWLDFNTDSDTRESIRKPAALVSALGLRLSHETLDMSGVVVLSEWMDTIGFFTREVSSLVTHHIRGSWKELVSLSPVSKPYSLCSRYADSHVANRSPTL